MYFQRCEGGIIGLNLAHFFIIFSLLLGFPLVVLLIAIVVFVLDVLIAIVIHYAAAVVSYRVPWGRGVSVKMMAHK